MKDDVREALEWRCFHCGEVFLDHSCAQAHFGRDETSEPACLIKAGAERSILKALRRAEADAAEAWAAIQNETTDAAKAYHAQSSRHHEQLRAAEELGYERGLRDAALASQSVGWRTMESAPKDGTPVLLWFPKEHKHDALKLGWYRTAGKNLPELGTSGWWSWGADGRFFAEPIAWQPFLAPPSSRILSALESGDE